MNDKSKALKPLKAKIETLEEAICKLEEELDQVTSGLQTANENQDAGEIVKLSKHLHNLQRRIPDLFEELEKTVGIYNEKNSYFEELLGR